MILEAVIIGLGLFASGAMIASAISLFTNTVTDIYAELKANAESQPPAKP